MYQKADDWQDSMMDEWQIAKRRLKAEQEGLDKHPAFNNPQAFRFNPVDLIPIAYGLAEEDISSYEWMCGMPTTEHAGCYAEWHKKKKGQITHDKS